MLAVEHLVEQVKATKAKDKGNIYIINLLGDMAISIMSNVGEWSIKRYNSRMSSFMEQVRLM